MSVRLNEALAKQQGVTEEQRAKMPELYKELEEAFDYAHAHPELGFEHSIRVKAIEFKLQENWNFPQNELFHTYQFRIPGCICPIMDNQERFGHEKIYVTTCPIHSELCKGM